MTGVFSSPVVQPNGTLPGGTSLMNVDSARELTKGTTANPLVLVTLLDTLLTRPVWLEWEGPTIWRELELEFGIVCSDITRNKIRAAKTCLVCDRPYEEWDVFEMVCCAFSSMTPSPLMIRKPGSIACGATMVQMSSIRPHPFSSEVFRYVAATLADDGVGCAPDVLHPANKYLELISGSGPVRDALALLSTGNSEQPSVQKARDIVNAVNEEVAVLAKQLSDVLGSDFLRG